MDDPTPADLEMLRDAMHGSPCPRPAAEGIADMQARIAQLTADKQRLLEQLSNHLPTSLTDDRQSRLEKRLAEVNQGLTEAQSRLREYQVQQQSLN